MFILFLVILQNLWAYPCPPKFFNDEKVQDSHQWLSRFEGQGSLHGCQIDIVTCDPAREGQDSSPLAEIWIKTKEGREAYVSVEFLSQPTPQLKTKAQLHKRAFYYKKRDRYYEPVNGRTEFSQLELRTLWTDPKQLDHIDIGLYTTHSRLDQPNGNQSHWYRCASKVLR